MQAELARARDMIARGEFAEADAVLSVLRARAPTDINVLNLATVLALRTGDDAAASDYSAQAFGMLPEHPTIRANRVLALTRAASASLKTGACNDAAHAAIQVLQIDPHAGAARSVLLQAAIAAASAGQTPLPDVADWPAGAMPSLSVVTCSIDSAKQARFEASLQAHFAGVDLELLVINDARSLAEAYARGLAGTSHPYVLFCHDDIAFARPDFAPRLFSALQQFDLVGVAGCTRLTGPSALWSGPGHAFCQIGQRDPSGQLLASLYGLGAERIGGAMALDGVFLACHRSVATQVGFDADRFDHFHLYDTDFSYRAHLAGYRVGIAQDLLLIHDSLGNFDARWQAQADRFLAKFPALAGNPADPERILLAPIAEHELLAVYTELRAWLNPLFPNAI
ncbi:hypothetical protein C7S18_23255 [Ahniella affigens]|uniref:Streptomycin biosynthesis protein StrF domain-containing protein n=1 Tax=Ahniella affigens TaxID=2021234 RepID=A0A2P1PYJ0_9GAMM|nr:glycosyltransferase [Ahniella affigens]AVP99912.1 hypothetical protein C7S18_23255 [Ahniella affigens]